MSMPEGERQQYRLAGRLPAYQRRVTEAIQFIQRATNEHPGVWSVGLSGGKDSVCVLELAVAAGWRGPCLHFYYRETPAENLKLAQAAAEKRGLEFHTLLVPGAFDVYDEVGHFFPWPTTDIEKSACHRMLKAYKATVENYVRRQDWVGQFWGLRKAESRPRKITLNRYGAIYKTQIRSSWTCCPLMNWSGQDVWAYIVNHDLPYLEVYDDSERGRERERSEMTWLAENTVWLRGRGIEMRRRYPDVWADLCRRYQGLAQWG